MPRPTEEEFLAAFTAADKDGNGQLTVGELKQLVISLQPWKAEDKDELDKLVNRLILMADDNDDKMLNYAELVPLLLGKPDKKVYLKGMFKSYDTDGSGYVSRKELAKIMDIDDESDDEFSVFTKQILDKVLQDNDADGDGKLSFDEFCAYIGYD